MQKTSRAKLLLKSVPVRMHPNLIFQKKELRYAHFSSLSKDVNIHNFDNLYLR